MSRAYEVSFDIAAAVRERIVEERVSSKTEEFYNRYLKQYEQMKSEDFEKYIPSEMNQLRSDLDEIRNNLVSDPFEARDISFDVGNYIRNLWSLGKTARNQFERAERMREELRREEKKERRSNLQKRYYALVENIADPAVVHFALPALRRIKEQIDSGQWSDSGSLDRTIRQIVSEAKDKADVWKQEQKEACKKENMTDRLTEAEEQIKKSTSTDNTVNNEMLERIRLLKRKMERDEITVEDVTSQLQTIETQADEAMIYEDIRKETVRSIYRQLKRQEFSVAPPELIERDGKSFVRIVASKPSGKTAVCQIGLDGKLTYKFGQYEGMTCIKDIEKFNVDLEKIYSVKLSDERVIWENPNRLSKDSINNSNSQGGKA